MINLRKTYRGIGDVELIAEKGSTFILGIWVSERADKPSEGGYIHLSAREAMDVGSLMVDWGAKTLARHARRSRTTKRGPAPAGDKRL